MDYESCEGCGCIECECDRYVEAYECEKCGYTPTRRELNNGSCPECRENRRIDREIAAKKEKEKNG